MWRIPRHVWRKPPKGLQSASQSSISRQRYSTSALGLIAPQRILRTSFVSPLEVVSHVLSRSPTVTIPPLKRVLINIVLVIKLRVVRLR